MSPRLKALLSTPPVAMLPIGVTPDGETTEYAMVTPACMIIAGDEVLVGVDAVWSTHVCSN
jgi:hypothetical protein